MEKKYFKTYIPFSSSVDATHKIWPRYSWYVYGRCTMHNNGHINKKLFIKRCYILSINDDLPHILPMLKYIQNSFYYLRCTHIFLRILSVEKGSSYLRRIPSNTIKRTYKKKKPNKNRCQTLLSHF